ncbi:MAG: formate dehydrogenase accessory protein FdhE [Thermodesulfovibrionales bacterium]|nr:formate dehydrogenase accessory protein FdhE [Thermodesulfovibrionales bacterium]
MSESLEKKKEQIAWLKKKSPAYKEILNFYEMVVKEQENFKPTLNVAPIEIREDLRTLQIKEGFPLISKEDFTLDISSSVRLFESICQIGKNATDKMKEDIQAIEETIRNRALDPEDLLERHYDETYLDKIAEKLEIDKAILKFLIHMSIKPSIEANVDKLKDLVDLKMWFKGYCPICGSLPQMSELRGEGQRYFLCSFCGFEWPGERLKCPFCENRDHGTLHYFYVEGQEVYRVDVCDKCQQYIKTADTRKLDYEPDLELEDIMTTHLDILASEKGFKRPVPSPWGL